ncbi:hypothetical protein E3N88_01210 [Mikania micrantha]|uniref:Uncharacterized protein n=1 Tax=Mikania micrantha TaxID=192012 RepID=A0A5N6Q0C3_9ASTR|nr:hypothetical protein E3N88_01210 [Mikania micrantha]
MCQSHESYKELVFATNGFSGDNCIGKDELVAVKLLDSDSLDADYGEQELDYGVDLFSHDLSGTLAGGGTGESPAIGTPVDDSTPNEVDFALALQASSSSTPISSKVVCNHLKGLGFNNEKGKGLPICNKFTNYEDDSSNNFDNNHVRESNSNRVDDQKTGKMQLGKDWWWKQDGSGGVGKRKGMK